MIGNKKSVRFDSSNPSNCRYRQTPSTERIEETISHACFHIKWVFGTSLITKTKGEHRSSSSVHFWRFHSLGLRMPSLPSRDFSPNSTAKIGIFQPRCSITFIFLRSHVIVFCLFGLDVAKIQPDKRRKQIIVNL